MRTQVAIVGAGPTGLLLSHLLDLEGVTSVLVECRSAEYVKGRIHAGILESGTVELIKEVGLGDRLGEEALKHRGMQGYTDWALIPPSRKICKRKPFPKGVLPSCGF